MLVDAHTHLDHYEPEQLPEVLAEIDRLDVLTLANSLHLDSYRRNLEIARDNPRIVVGLGVHPWHAAAWVERLAELEPYLAAAPFFGEIGLDFHWVEDPATYPAQREVFDFFLAAARELDRPVNLHTKGAEAEILARLDHFGIRRAIIHWYSGPLDPFTALVERGYAFTVGVEVLHSDAIRELARRIPLDQLLTETDGPTGLAWLTGEPGYPHHLVDVLAELARLRGEREEILQEAVAQNAQRLLGLSAHL